MSEFLNSILLLIASTLGLPGVEFVTFFSGLGW